MIIVITRPDFFADEAERIVGLFDRGNVDLVHIRKPLDGMSGRENLRDMENLIRALPTGLYDRFVVHDNFELAVRYGLRGVHLNRRNPQAPDGWKGTVSISCHSLAELTECRKHDYTYMSLSPIFDSISKQGYRSAFTREQLEVARDEGIIDTRVMALGGVTFERVSEVERMGFGGSMILGDAWR